MPLEYEKNGKKYVVPDFRRREGEIWTRVMGYYRPVSEFNVGKKQEYKVRGSERERNNKGYKRVTLAP